MVAGTETAVKFPGVVERVACTRFSALARSAVMSPEPSSLADDGNLKYDDAVIGVNSIPVPLLHSHNVTISGCECRKPLASHDRTAVNALKHRGGFDASGYDTRFHPFLVNDYGGDVMSTLYVEPADRAQQLLPLVRAAVNGEIVRLELALKLAMERLLPFERKYGVTSNHFMEHMVAEDLQGGDDEYVQWAGEYHLLQRLEEKLARLQEVEYGDPVVLRRA